MADLIKSLQNLVNSVAESFSDLKADSISEENCQKCHQVCIDTINYFNTILLDSNTSVQMRRSVQAQIVQLCWYADQFSKLSGKVTGGDLNNRRLIN